MELGNFSLSLAVKDVAASKSFYETLGFRQVLGNVDQGWAIMKNGNANIGLFQGMFDKNLITFNPGWSQSGDSTNAGEDIRHIQQRLKVAGLEVGAAIKSASGPANFIVTDPDGNSILFDQHT